MLRFIVCFSLVVAALGLTLGTMAQQPPTGKPAQTQKPDKPKQTLTDPEIQEARNLLDRLGYWVKLIAEEDKDKSALRHALIAFQKVEGRTRTGVLTSEELEALRTAKKPAPLESGYSHIEIDLYRQVLVVVECANVPLRILPISSGSGEWFTEGGVTRQAITPTGKFKVYRKIKGWRKSPLGLLYYPNYIYGGVAIHGNPSVPTRPASHGCIRIPMFASQEFSEISSIGMEVIVYDSNPLAEANGPAKNIRSSGRSIYGCN